MQDDPDSSELLNVTLFPEGTRPQTPPVEPEEDFYYEGDFIVFTAGYHLRRGYCCQSGCRHCPFPPSTGFDAK